MLKADGSGPSEPPIAMSEELPETSNQDEETKIFYFIDEEDTPYLIKLPGVRRDQVVSFNSFLTDFIILSCVTITINLIFLLSGYSGRF